LRGIEGARVRETYKLIAKKYGVEWKARNYDTTDWDKGDLPNRCLSSATACLYGVTEAAVLAAGYAPAIGFIHTGKPLSFVYDVADIYKFDTVVPMAFKIASKNPHNPEQQVRLACRDIFRETRLLERIIPGIEEMLAAGEISPPTAAEEAVAPALPNPASLGDAGHRS
jgi:CRISPR-associated protein Cas1